MPMLNKFMTLKKFEISLINNQLHALQPLDCRTCHLDIIYTLLKLDMAKEVDNKLSRVTVIPRKLVDFGFWKMLIQKRKEEQIYARRVKLWNVDKF